MEFGDIIVGSPLILIYTKQSLAHVGLDLG